MTPTSIYIPYVHYTCSEDRIKYVFERDRLGNVSRVDFIKKNGNNGGYYVAFVHFNYWYNNIAAINLKNKIDAGEEGRVVYNDPYYWIIYKNINPIVANATSAPFKGRYLPMKVIINAATKGSSTNNHAYLAKSPPSV